MTYITQKKLTFWVSFLLLKHESESYFKAEHEWLGCPDAARLVAVEIVAQTRVDVDSKMLPRCELHPDSEAGRSLYAFDVFLMGDRIVQDFVFV